MMGADIDMQSTPGQGSVFWMDLRLAPATGRTAAPAHRPVDSKDGAAMVHRLENLLAADDIRAAEVFTEGEAFLQQALDWRFETLARQIASFEYDKALETLREWKKASP